MNGLVTVTVKMKLVFLAWIFMIDRGSATLPTWNMHGVCGQTISQTDRGGFLVFDSYSLPAGYKMDCRVVIQPAPTESSTTSGHYVLFHFSNFKVGENCQHTNVTVIDGNGINMKPIEGLTSPMCGTNSSLTKDVTFRTQSYYITVVFQRDATGLNFISKFNMTFLSFSEGSCGSENEDLFSCTNDRCIDKKFTCQNLNPCGDNSDCSTKEATDTIESAFDVIKYIAIGIFVVVAIGIFCGGCKRFRNMINDIDIRCPRCRCLRDLLGACRRCEFCADLPSACERPRCECCREQFSSARDRASTACKRCSCCGILVGGILDACRRLKRNLTPAQQAQSQNGNPEVADPEPVTQATAVSEERRERNSSRSWLSSESSSEQSRSSSVSETFGASNNAFDDDDDDGDAFGRNHSHGATGSSPDAPPSYREAVSSKQPAPSAPPSSPETPAPPSYDEVVANVTKYVK